MSEKCQNDSVTLLILASISAFCTYASRKPIIEGAFFKGRNELKKVKTTTLRSSNKMVAHPIKQQRIEVQDSEEINFLAVLNFNPLDVARVSSFGYPADGHVFQGSLTPDSTPGTTGAAALRAWGAAGRAAGARASCLR